MSTRGLLGLRKGGHDKAVYNHSDSYPEYLGREFLNFIKEIGIEKLDAFYDQIQELDETAELTEEQREQLYPEGGTLEAWKNAIDSNQMVRIENYIDFIKNSLFCEYAYILDLDSKKLEYYVGWQKKSVKSSRYKTSPADFGYVECRLVQKFTLNEIEQSVEECIEKMQKGAARYI